MAENAADTSFTSRYRDKPEIIRAAQICGARLTSDFFPRWRVDAYDLRGCVEVKQLNLNKARVTVYNENHTESVTVGVPDVHHGTDR